ncbi:hypothetical protein GCM10007320_43680 [Pseudorhodoferax aquiterrae]|uniref:Uncharacterized protein n=1 Tax=Pseudorhodoferax aquiterrae TaxID=747304 RepID=A0ABQ3G689_9BURK|nr:hypothetical protein [Pseudorhodoferax aquiterrae]GHC93024.1 hypothetical protein GCM10007320_43680 [Pseudorhodoferax aquiterrae]
MLPLDYARSLNAQLSYLFHYAKSINEIDTAAATWGEFRGAQDPGWNTMQTAHEVADELKALGSRPEPLSRSDLRQLLCLYAHLAEAGGVYEGLLNVLQVAQLKAYSSWPFQDMVRVRQAPAAVIGPNANAMFRRLSATSLAIGMPKLSELLAVTFRDDVRNAIAHADYVIGADGLRIRRRNGGRPDVVSFDQLFQAIQIAVCFWDLLHQFQRSVAESFRPGRTVVGRFSANPPMPWLLELNEGGGFSIESSAPGPQPDAAYERQQGINDRLGGRMMAIYLAPGAAVPLPLENEIAAAGFDPLVVAMEDTQQLDRLVADVAALRLWDGAAEPTTGRAGVLMVTPSGFRHILSEDDFRSWLPGVHPLDLA